MFHEIWENVCISPVGDDIISIMSYWWARDIGHPSLQVSPNTCLWAFLPLPLQSQWFPLRSYGMARLFKALIIWWVVTLPGCPETGRSSSKTWASREPPMLRPVSLEDLVSGLTQGGTCTGSTTQGTESLKPQNHLWVPAGMVSPA